MKQFHTGDHVVYRFPCTSPQPPAKARCVFPARHGDGGSFAVEEYSVVMSAADGRNVTFRTADGRYVSVSADDPCLRRAGILDHVFRRARLPPLRRQRGIHARQPVSGHA